MRALVVGADGFAGRWLVRHLHESGDEVVGLVGPRYRPPLAGAARTLSADVRAYEPLAEAVSDAKPDALYYLAAVSQAGGREQVADAARIGLVGAIHALTACSQLKHPVRMLHVSSAHVYGAVEGRPLTEADQVQPASVYGSAKAASEAALLQLAPAVGVEVVVARAFNHIGPGQAPSFLVPSLASQVRAISPGGRGIVVVGKPQMIRDFTDVRDVARAYRLLAQVGQPGGVYNVASGSGTSVADIVALMLRVAGRQAELRVDSSLARGDEPRVMIGDARKVEALGWRRALDLEDTLVDVLNDPAAG